MGSSLRFLGHGSARPFDLNGRLLGFLDGLPKNLGGHHGLRLQGDFGRLRFDVRLDLGDPFDFGQFSGQLLGTTRAIQIGKRDREGVRHFLCRIRWAVPSEQHECG